MIEAVEMCVKNLDSLRNMDSFKEIYESAEELFEQNDLDPIPMERPRKLPRKIDQGASNHSFTSAEEKYRAEYYSVIDSTTNLLNSYFDSPHIKEFKAMSECLICSLMVNMMEIYAQNIQNSVKISNTSSSSFIFSMYNGQFSNLDECHKLFKNLVPEVRSMFTQVEALLRFLLVSPASSCTAERSFSALRRVKTWLRSTMGQECLDSLMLCHIHQDRLMDIDPNQIARVFISNGTSNIVSTRSRLFGSY